MFPCRPLNPYLLRVVACLTVAVTLVSTSVARAEENVWTFEVRDLIEKSPLAHEIHLVPAPRGVEFPRTCEKLVIHAQLERGKGVPPKFVRFFTPEGYTQAIRQIRQARVNNALVKLGSLDGGFGRSEEAEDECIVFSAGLAILMIRNQQPGIFSVF